MTGGSILELTRDLCAFDTGVVTPGNEAFFARVAEELPVTLHRFPSGSEFNGWLVPDTWWVEHATVSRGSEVVFDCGGHALGVAALSQPFRGTLDLDELLAHVVTTPSLPDAFVYHCMWQYRPWEADWALSIPHRSLAVLRPGRYDVELVTRSEPGEMLVAALELPGRSDRTIVFNAHTCHPRMANDDQAGVAILIRLFQWLAERDTHYSYRLVLGPEHLGTVFYLRDQPEEVLKRIVGGVFAEMPGTGGPLTAASTFLGAQPIDLAVANAVKHRARRSRFVPWRMGAGNDETVWEAPGYEVPFVELSRSEDILAPYREYHTSLDTPELMQESQLEEFFDVLLETVEILEANAVVHRRFDGLVCLSNPRYELYRERPDPAVKKDLPEESEKWGYLADSLLRYFDGSLTVLEIAERHDLPFVDVYEYLRRFEEKELVRMAHVAIDRTPISRAREVVPDG